MDLFGIVVMPCFNEEQLLATSCASLGFGIGYEVTPNNSLLILVDNNSTDATIEIAKKIKNASRQGSVVIGSEYVQGFIPARHRGNIIAQQTAKSLGIELERILILQVDADTQYSRDYISQMKDKSAEVGAGTLVEACIYPPDDIDLDLKKYLALCSNLDAQYQPFFSSIINFDVVIDDKVACYRLSDYFKWGEHRQEFFDGEEIFAETTRLFIKSKAYGAKRTLSNKAWAVHSVRKINENPLLHLSTAGFPREQSYNLCWLLPKGKMSLQELIANQNAKIVKEACNSRLKHLLLLFYALPLHIDNTINQQLLEKSDLAKLIILNLPNRTLSEVISKPGIFLKDIFTLLNDYGDKLLQVAKK